MTSHFTQYDNTFTSGKFRKKTNTIEFAQCGVVHHPQSFALLCCGGGCGFGQGARASIRRSCAQRLDREHAQSIGLATIRHRDSQSIIPQFNIA